VTELLQSVENERVEADLDGLGLPALAKVGFLLQIVPEAGAHHPKGIGFVPGNEAQELLVFLVGVGCRTGRGSTKRCLDGLCWFIERCTFWIGRSWWAVLGSQRHCSDLLCPGLPDLLLCHSAAAGDWATAPPGPSRHTS